MRQSQVISDLRTVRELGGIICWQEISRDRYKSALHSEFTAEGGWATEHLEVEIPISYKTKWYELVDSGVVLTHEGLHLVSPDRYISWVLLRRKDAKSNSMFYVVNTHFVSGGWSRKFQLKRKWRQAKWLEHWQIMKDLILGFHAKGITVIGGGDFNRQDTPTFDKDMQWFTGHVIDKLFLLQAPSGVHLKAVDLSAKEGLNTDHRPRVLTFTRTS